MPTQPDFCAIVIGIASSNRDWLALEIAVFKALSDPTRLRLIKLLSTNAPDLPPGEMCNGGGFLCVNALAHKLGVTQSAVSQHLRVLRQAGLVKSDRRGAFVHYTLAKDGLADYRDLLRETLGEDLFG